VNAHRLSLRPLWTVLLLALVAANALPARAADEAKAPKMARLSGSIHDEAGKPVAGAKLVLTPLEARGAALTVESDAGGKYVFPAVARGLYDLAVAYGGKAYVSNRSLLVPPLKKVVADFRLSPVQTDDKLGGIEAGKPAPGLNAPIYGVARLVENTEPTGLAWFRTGKGVAVLVGGGALVVAALIASGGKSNDYVSTTTTTTTSSTSVKSDRLPR